MKTSVGSIDRVLRTALGGGLIAWAAAFNGPALACLGAIPLLTGLVGTFGLYSLPGSNTCRVKT